MRSHHNSQYSHACCCGSFYQSCASLSSVHTSPAAAVLTNITRSICLFGKWPPLASISAPPRAGSWMRIYMQILSPFLVNTRYKLWWRSAVGSSGRYKEVLRCEGSSLTANPRPQPSQLSATEALVAKPWSELYLLFIELSWASSIHFGWFLSFFIIYILGLSKNVLEGHHPMSYYSAACGNNTENMLCSEEHP